MVTLAATHFMDWLRAYDGHGPIQRIRQDAEQQRNEVLERARHMLTQGRDPAEALEYLANTLTNKLLHTPSSNLRSAALRGDADLLRAADQLYAREDRSK